MAVYAVKENANFIVFRIPVYSATVSEMSVLFHLLLLL